MFTQDQLKERLRYDPATGNFTWTNSVLNRIDRQLAPAGSIYSNGYRYILLECKDYRAGRLAWFYMTGKWSKCIDHINGIKDDDRFANLRESNNSLNQANRGKPINNTSGFKGVRFEASRWKWRAQIVVNGKSKNLGRYETVEEAREAYAKAARTAWGDHARV